MNRIPEKADFNNNGVRCVKFGSSNGEKNDEYNDDGFVEMFILFYESIKKN